MRTRDFIAIGLLLACAGRAVVWAQPAPDPTPPPVPRGAEPPAPPVDEALLPFENRPIGRITVLAVPPGAPADAEPAPADRRLLDLVRNQLRLTEGSAFLGVLVSEDISRLNRLGRFRRVESRVQMLADGSVELVYLIVEQPVIQAVQPVGNRVFSDEEIQREIGFLEGTPFDQAQLDRVARRIEERYRARGFYNARVSVDQNELAGTGIVLLRIREGERTRVSLIRFEGVTVFTRRELINVIRTKEAGSFEKGLFAVFEPSPVDDERLAEDVASIIAYYRDRGYLDVRADRVVTPSPDGSEAIVTFVVDEGPVYTLRSIGIERIAPDDQPPVFSEAQLLGLIPIKPGDVYSDSLVRASVQAIAEAYGKLGFADVQVNRRQLRDPDQPVVDLVVQIAEGRPFRTGIVEIRGNRLTRDDVVRRNLTIEPGRPLDVGAVADSERRLRQTRLFAPPSPGISGPRVAIRPEDPIRPGERDVLVEVQETNTGSFQFGAGVDSDGGVRGQFTIEQRNFDITDTPDTWGEFFSGESFRGGGQTFRIGIFPGSEVNQFTIGLDEPSLWGSDFSGSAALLYQTRDFRSYREQRWGGRFSVGRRLGDRWTVGVPFRLESVSLPQIDSDAPVDYFDVEDERFLGRVGLTLARQTLDDPILPAEGTRTQVGFDLVGLDETFTVIRGEHQRYLALERDVFGRATTLRLSTSASYIPQDNANVPFYERLYLGGNNFRGFAFQGVSPVGVRRDTGELGDDPIGGRWQFFAGAELKFPIYTDLLAGVLFIDTGTVDTDISFGKYRVSVGFGFRVTVAQLSNVPFAFDFGFPILKEDTDRERFFTLTVDLPFN